MKYISNYHWRSHIGSGNGLEPRKTWVINWTDDDQMCYCINASHSLNESMMQSFDESDLIITFIVPFHI